MEKRKALKLTMMIISPYHRDRHAVVEKNHNSIRLLF